MNFIDLAFNMRLFNDTQFIYLFMWINVVNSMVVVLFIYQFVIAFMLVIINLFQKVIFLNLFLVF